MYLRCERLIQRQREPDPPPSIEPERSHWVGSSKARRSVAESFSLTLYGQTYCAQDYVSS